MFGKNLSTCKPGLFTYLFTVAVVDTAIVWLAPSWVPTTALLIIVIVVVPAILIQPFIKFTEMNFRSIIKILGRRTSRVVDEGVCMLIPFIETLEKVSCKRETETFVIPGIFTPEDKAEIIITIEVTYQPQDLYTYLEVKDLKQQLSGMIAEAIRGFAADPHTPPKNWEEAVSMNEKFGRILVAKLSGQEIPRHKNGEHKRESEMTPEERRRKERTVKNYQSLSVGQGNFIIPGLGIVLRRFNITKIEPSEALSKTLEQIAKEKQERISQEMEAKTAASRLRAFLEQFGVPEEAFMDPAILQQYVKALGVDIGKLLDDFRIETGKSSEEVRTFRLGGDINYLAEVIASLFKKVNKGG